MHRARSPSTKMHNDRADIAKALLGFYDLGRSVTPMVSFRKQILFTIISTLFKNEQKFNVGSKKKKFKISVHGTWNPAILRLQGA